MHGFEVAVRGGIMVPESASPVQAPNFYPTGTPADVGDILRGVEHPYGFDPFGIAVSAGYRFFPWLSVGLSFTYASFYALDGTDTGDYVDSTSQLQRQMWTLGVYGRYYFTQFHSHLQPWAELGLSYSGDTASYVRGGSQASNGQAETQAYYLTEAGLDVRAMLGLDWRLAPVFAVGPWVSYERVVPIQACVEIDVDTNAPTSEQQFSGQNRCSNPPVQGNGYGVVAGGIGVKVTFDPFGH
jgi:hypothetical protein